MINIIPNATGIAMGSTKFKYFFTHEVLKLGLPIAISFSRFSFFQMEEQKITIQAPPNGKKLSLATFPIKLKKSV